MRSFIVALVVALSGATLVFGAGQATTEGASAAAMSRATGGPAIYASLSQYEAETGNRIDRFHESPMLAELVAAGELPPVEERLPDDPVVLQPWEEIGRYSPLLQLVGVNGVEETTTIHAAGNMSRLVIQSLDGREILPNITSGWETSPDYTSITIHLREGLKWSDGEPFSADDIMFWYESILLNDTLTPTKPATWSPGGALMKVRRLDDMTVVFDFAAPNPRSVETLPGVPMHPSHYLQQWHVDHNSDAGKLAQEEGFEAWHEAFGVRAAAPTEPKVVGRPTVMPWGLVRQDAAQNYFFERNPYFFKIDTAGNQLPYFDEVSNLFVNTAETVVLKAMNGEVHTSLLGLSFSTYPVYKQNEERGGYRVYLHKKSRTGTALAWAFNYTIADDPVLSDVFQDLRFRQASSLAVNREEIGKTVFFGQVEPWVAAVPGTWTGFESWMATHFAEYDPDRANALLDEMGLEWDAAHEYRLRPDGKTLEIVLQYGLDHLGEYPGQVLELIAEYWAAIGIRAFPKYTSPTVPVWKAGTNQIGIVPTGGAGEDLARRRWPMRLTPPFHWKSCCPMAGKEWRQWLDTGGESGIEPPDDMKRAYELALAWQATAQGTEEYEKLLNELLTINVQGLYLIGTVSAVPWVVIVRNDLGNFAREGGVFPYVYQPEQYFERK